MLAVPAEGHTATLVAAYITEKTGATFAEGTYAAFAVYSDSGQFVAAVVISNFRKTDCEVSCAAETAMAWRPHVCRAVFQYVFGQLGCTRCTCVTTRGNKRARAFLEAHNFVLEGNLRRGYDGKRDALIYGLLAEDCRFFNAGGHDGEKERTSCTDAT